MINLNDICYIIENWNRVSKVEIIAIQGEFYTVRFIERPRPSAAKLRRSRLYLTEEEARKVIDKNSVKRKPDLARKVNLTNKTHWPCMNQK